MNATVLSDNLYKAAYDVIHPVGDNGKRETRCQNESLPILAHVLVTDHEGRLALYTHDLEEPLVTYAAARVDEPFAICVPAHPFLDWLDIIKKDLARVELTIDPLTCSLVLQADNARATFKCLDAEEFPSVRDAQEPGAKDPTLAGVGLAVSRDPARPQLQRVCHRDGLMIAADGLRLHLAPSEKTDIPEGFPDVTEVLATLDYPGYTVIIPAPVLVRAVKNMKAVAKAGDGLITFHCNGSVEITAQSAEGDISRAHVEILNSTGGDVAFTFPVKHVLDALTHICPKVKAPRSKKGKRPEPQAVTIHAAAAVGHPVWFTNGDLRAAIMPTLDEAEAERRARIRELMTPAEQSCISPEDIQRIVDWITQTQDPAEVAARHIYRREYEPHPETPAYTWCNQVQCYVLHHAPA